VTTDGDHLSFQKCCPINTVHHFPRLTARPKYGLPKNFRQISSWKLAGTVDDRTVLSDSKLLRASPVTQIPILARLTRKRRRVWRKLNVHRLLEHWRRKKGAIIAGSTVGIDVARLGLSERGLNAVREELTRVEQVVIAKIDHDGFFLSGYGPITGLPCVSESQFLRRKRFAIDLVSIEGTVGVRKNYSGHRVRFLNEIEALYSLNRAGCNVPAILDINFHNYELTTSFIPGPVLREQLALQGAVLRDKDVFKDSTLASLPPRIQRLKRIEEGRRFLREVVDENFIERLYEQVVKIHSAGFLINDIKYGNVIIEARTGMPYLIDFENSDNISGFRPKIFRALIENDLRNFDLHFGTNKLVRKT
jgi:hypothetical protein